MNPAATDWSSVFRSDDYLHFYAWAINEQTTSKQVDFLIQHLHLPEQASILDVACGHGRHTTALAEQGYCVTGADVSKDFLRLAQQEADRRGLDITYLSQDMRYLPFDEDFDAALSLFTSFGFFNEADNMRTLEGIARSLKPGGRLVLDVVNRDGILAGFRPATVVEVGDDLLVDQNHFEPIDGTLHTHRIMVRDGKVRKVDFALRIYNPSEMRCALLKAGFTTVNFYAGWEASPLERNSHRLIAIAQK